MKVLQLLAIAAVFVFIVINGAARFDAPFWLVATIIIAPYVCWLYAPLFRARPVDLRERPDGRPPSLLDLLLDR
jgi:hypothetical protein